MRNKNEVYTKFTAEVKFDDGEIQTYTVSENHWDLDITQVGEKLRSLVLAMGYSEQGVDELFCDDCESCVEGPIESDDDEPDCC